MLRYGERTARGSEGGLKGVAVQEGPVCARIPETTRAMTRREFLKKTDIGAGEVKNDMIKT